MKLLVRFGDTYNNDNEELLVLERIWIRHCSVHLWNDCAFCSFKTGSSRCTRRKFKTEALERLKN
jgi:hypothetical protein